jgi:hypothetical protein
MNLIKHYGEGSKVAGKAVPADPTPEEISWILETAGRHKKNSVDSSEIELALDLWHSYVSNRPRIEATFAKYDTNHSQRLEFDQLKSYLTDLNEGHPPKVHCRHWPLLSMISIHASSRFYKWRLVHR